MKNILNWIEEKKQKHEGREPRTLLAKYKPGDDKMEQTEVLRPKRIDIFGNVIPAETLETWEPNPFLKPHAEGGRIGYDDGQLVRNTVDGSRPGYQGPDKMTRSQIYSTDTPLKMDYFRHGIRSDDPARLKKIDDFVKKYETEYDVKPTAKKIRTSLNVQRRVIPFYEAKYGKLPVGKAGGAAGRTMVIDEVKQILNDPKVIERLEKGKFPTIQQVERIIKKNISIAEGRLVDVAEKLKENKKYKSLANDYLKTVGHGSVWGGRSRKRSRVLYEKQLAEMFNIPVQISTLRKNILTKLYSIVPELKGIVGVDEIGSITASMKRSSGPYAIWGQIIGKDFNVEKGKTIDRAKSFMEAELINLPKDSPERSTLQTKYNIKVDEFELEANKNNPAKQVKGMKLSFEHPSKAIKNKKVYNLFKPLFDNHFEKYGFSYEVAADTDTLMDINKKLDKPFFKKQIKNNYSKIIKRSGKVGALVVIGTLAGTGWSLADEAQTAETGAVAERSTYEKITNPFELSFRDRAKILGTAAIGDWILLEGALTKAFKKGLPILWTPGAAVYREGIKPLVKKLMSGKEPKIEDFAEVFKEGGYDINSEEFKTAWNAAPEEKTKKLLYDLAGKTIDQRSTSEKIKKWAANPLTHLEYAWWASGAKAMEELLATNPGSSALKNKLRQWALFGIRSGIPMQVLKKISPYGWALTGATSYSAIQQKFEGKMRKTPLTESEQMDIQERKTAVPKMLDTYEQASKLAKDQGISYEDALKQINKPNVPGINFIDYSLPKPIETLAGGGMVGIRKPSALPPTGGPMSQGLAYLKKYGNI